MGTLNVFDIKNSRLRKIKSSNVSHKRFDFFLLFYFCFIYANFIKHKCLHNQQYSYKPLHQILINRATILAFDLSRTKPGAALFSLRQKNLLPLRHCFAVDTTVNPLLPVGEMEDMGQFLLGRGYTARILAPNNSSHLVRQLKLTLFN